MPRLSSAVGAAYLPFAFMATGGLLLGLMPGQPLDRREFAVAVVLAVLTFVARVRGRGRTGVAAALPALVYLLSVGVLRDATGGGAGGLGVLVLLPVVWTSLYADRRAVRVVIGGVAVVLATPLVAIGAPAYPAAGWRAAILFVAVAWMIGRAVPKLVDELRRSARQVEERDRERTELLASLERLAATDSLTDVPNRRSWERVLDSALAAEVLPGTDLCVAMLDVDHFKEINDAGGHAAGDAALRACTLAWLGALRDTDTLARLGGDEFAVLLPHCALVDAVDIVARLRATTPPGITASAGVVERRADESSRSLLARADDKLYAAKHAGRDHLVAT